MITLVLCKSSTKHLGLICISREPLLLFMIHSCPGLPYGVKNFNNHLKKEFPKRNQSIKVLNKMLSLQHLIAASLLFLSVSFAGPVFPDAFFEEKHSFKLPQNRYQSVKKDISNSKDLETFALESHPNHKLRTKVVDPSKLGVDDVFQVSGYLDVEDEKKHFFFWYFDSRSPMNETDDLIMWLNGGPGCSSFTGLFGELGPASITEDLEVVKNAYSWNSNASMIFLEQPVGVGYSYFDEDADSVTGSNAAAKDVYAFLDLFFSKFPHLISKKFHISGESYAGHYLPAIANEIAIVHKEDAKFKLSSVLIGNGITDPIKQHRSYYDMACNPALSGVPQLVSDSDCHKMQANIPRCEALLTACYASELDFACVLANTYCDAVGLEAFSKTGLNVYDVRGPCETDNGNCYLVSDYIDAWANQPSVQNALGSDIEKYTGCSNDVYGRFAFSGDGAKPFQQYVAQILDQGIPVLIYAGDKDFICNWLGNMYWTDALDWKYQEDFAAVNLQPWYVDGAYAGQKKSYGGLTFLRVYDAGHMVPMNQPENSLAFLNSWILIGEI